MNVYDFKAKNNLGEEVSLRNYKGKVLLIVNTASKCGLTPQYEGLQHLYEKYGNEKFEILGFPCNQFANQEPGNSSEIKQFCTLNYGVTFPIFEKIDVNGDNTLPLFKYLKETTSGFMGNKIKWNFTKFLVDSNGNVIERFSPMTKPSKLGSKIQKLINEIK
ncbi:MAG: glutathione peroxidase [Firmicutes bacterium]|nr:glutathione peroxidase [Bacillota bacterium]